MRSFGDIALALLSALFIIAGTILIVQKYTLVTFFNIAVSAFFSLIVPIGFILARRQIRIGRIHAAEVFKSTFEPSAGSNSYFEFLGRKYYDNVTASPGMALVPKPSQNPPLMGSSDWLLLGSAIPFIVLTAFGFFALLAPYGELTRLFYGSASSLAPSSFLSPDENSYEVVVTLGSLTFISAFLYSVRMFLKSLIAYDLTALTMLRAFTHVLFAIMISTMIWRVAPDAEPFAAVAEKVQNTLSSDSRTAARSPRTAPVENHVLTATAVERVPKIWLILAFAIGFLPDAAFSWLLQRLRLALNRRDARMVRQTPIVPLTVIDGIDFLTAFRLEEGNIAAVQNLAVANPIMLHIETSYCIFTIMDWIAQAQLCAASGPERFVFFRKLNIRTIFDLERSVLDPDSPPGLKQMAGAVLLATSSAKPSLFKDFSVRPLDIANRDFDKALASWVNIEVIEQLVRVMMDSLHIQRFRQFWRDMEGSIASTKGEKLQRTAPRFSPPPPVPSNGGGREPHAVEIASTGKAASRDMQTEIHGE